MKTYLIVILAGVLALFAGLHFADVLAASKALSAAFLCASSTCAIAKVVHDIRQPAPSQPRRRSRVRRRRT